MSANSAPAPVPFARTTCRALLYMIAILSYGNFNPAFFGGAPPVEGSEDASPQQFIVLGLWILLIGCSMMREVLVAPQRRRGLLLPAIFLAYVMASPAWSDHPLAMAPKAGAFMICSIGVWRLTSIFSVKEVLDIVIRTMTVLLVASAVAIVINPAHAISREYRFEAGQFEELWQGVFAQKQGLGMVAGTFAFLMLMRTINRRSFINFLGFVLALVLIVGSGSRGGAVMAALTPVAIMIARRQHRFFSVIINVMLAELLIAWAMIAYLAYTGYDEIFLWGHEIDFTERTYIWQYGIHLWLTRPFFGFGLNGFWTDPNILWGFLRIHGWVLDNHHSGYVAILVETGLVGMGLFSLLVWTLCSRLRTSLRGGTTEVKEMALGLLLMTFTINLTETIFMRSTNFEQILFTFLLINVFSPGAPMSYSQRMLDRFFTSDGYRRQASV